jgi:xylulokinase
MIGNGYLFAIDIGTTNIKAGIFDTSGKLISIDQREHHTYLGENGAAEQNPDEVWDVQCTVCCMVMNKSKLDPKKIQGIAISSQRCTFVLVDENRKPVTNYISWMDTRGVPYLDTIARTIGSTAFYTLTGIPLIYTPSFSKLLWVKDNWPDRYKKARRFHLVQTHHLCRMGVDEELCDYANASLTGLYAVDELQWSANLINQFGLSFDFFPRLLPSGTAVGKLSKTAAEQMGLAAGTPIILGGGDLACAGIGSGVAQENRITINHGTGAGVLTYLDAPKRDRLESFPCGTHVAPNAWELEAHDQASGASMKWFRDVFSCAEKNLCRDLSIDAYDLLALEARTSPVGANGLLFIPTFCGLTQPIRMNNLRAMMFGLRLDHNRSDFIRAMMEGGCFGLKWMIESLEGQGFKFSEVIVTGGASNSELWNEIHADIYNLPVRVPKISESSLVGAAILSGLGIGVFNNIHEAIENMVKYRKMYTPNTEHTGIYEEVYDKFKRVMHTTHENRIHEWFTGG